MVFNFTLANDSDEMLFADGFDGDWNYKLILKDANERDAPLTAYSKLKETPHVQRRTGRVLHPGEKIDGICRSYETLRLGFTRHVSTCRSMEVNPMGSRSG